MRRLSLMVTILIAFILINIKVSEAQRTFPSKYEAEFEDGQPGNMLGILFLCTY